MRAGKPKPAHAIGSIVCARWFKPGYPIGVGTDTRLVVREIIPASRSRVAGQTIAHDTRYRCENDDGRGGTYWFDEPELRAFGGV